MGNRFLLIEQKVETPSDVAAELRKLSDHLRGVTSVSDARKLLLQTIRRHDMEKALGSTRIRWIWDDVRHMDDVESVQDYLVNLSRSIEKEGLVRLSWKEIAKALGQLEMDLLRSSTPLVGKRKKVKGKEVAKQTAKDIVKDIPDDLKLKKEETELKVGDRVRVIGKPHEKGHATGKIALIDPGPAYGIVFDGEQEIHKWYVGSELEKVDAANESSDLASRWDEMTGGERYKMARAAGFDEDAAGALSKKSWALLTSQEQKDLEWALKAPPEQLPPMDEQYAEFVGNLKKVWSPGITKLLDYIIWSTPEEIEEWVDALEYAVSQTEKGMFWDNEDVQHALRLGIFDKTLGAVELSKRDRSRVDGLKDRVVQMATTGVPEPEPEEPLDSHYLAPRVPMGAATAGGESAMEIGDMVEVSDGPWKGMKGVVRSVGRMIEVESKDGFEAAINGVLTRLHPGDRIEVFRENIAKEAFPGQIPSTGHVENQDDPIGWDTMEPWERHDVLKSAGEDPDLSLHRWKDLPDDVAERVVDYVLTIGERRRRKVNPWAVCAAQGLKPGTASYERCVLSVKKEYGIKEDEEPDDDDIRRALEDKIEQMANAHAAEAWSTPTDEMTMELGDDVWVLADFGGKVAVNGDLVDEIPKAPEGFKEMPRQGGRVPTTEEEVSVEHAVRAVARDLNVPQDRVQKVADDAGYEELAYLSVSGETEVWAKPKAEEPVGEADAKMRPPTIDRKTKSAINKVLSDISAKYWPTIPTFEIGEELKKHGIRMEDFILTGHQGRATIDLYMGDDMIANSVLSLSWFKMPVTGHYEIVAYLS